MDLLSSTYWVCAYWTATMNWLASPTNDSSPQAFMHNSLPGCRTVVASHDISRTADSANFASAVPSHRNLCVTDAVSRQYHGAEAGAPIVGVLHEAADAYANALQASGSLTAILGGFRFPRRCVTVMSRLSGGVAHSKHADCSPGNVWHRS